MSHFLRAVSSRPSVLPKVDSNVSRRVFAAVGLGGAAQPPSALGGTLSRDLFESRSGAQSHKSSAANGHGNGQEGITPTPEALLHEKSMTEGEKNAPLRNILYPFPGFGSRDSSEQEQISFPQHRKGVQEVVMKKRKR